MEVNVQGWKSQKLEGLLREVILGHRTRRLYVRSQLISFRCWASSCSGHVITCCRTYVGLRVALYADSTRSPMSLGL